MIGVLYYKLNILKLLAIPKRLILKKLIHDIQYELDISWAVLGELYGNMLNKPEIRYRRITSNLEENNFVGNQIYVADKFAFKANDEIIKLLIAPLYGDDPTYGIRELLQNSVDACKEREKLEISGQYISQISIAIVKEDTGSYCIITDNGIGMDADILKNYFLSAGASFRKSIEWQKEFIDNNGDSKVRRSGRFGIGVLAAFLIGKELEVSTRNIRSKTGYYFTTDINTKQINILKDNSIDVGTRIKIKISNLVQKSFNPQKVDQPINVKWYEWYTLLEPQIKYYYLEKEISIKKLNPGLNNYSKEWSEINSDGYNKILWTYSTKFNPAKFTCNGIVIPDKNETHKIEFSLIAKVPKISVFDNSAFLPLNLNRNSFTKTLSFQKELEEDVYKDFIAYILTCDIKDPYEKNKLSLYDQDFDYPPFSGFYSHLSYIYGQECYKNYNKWLIRSYLISKKGYTLDYAFFIKKLKKLDVLFLQTDDTGLINLNFDIKDHFIKLSVHNINSIEDYKLVIEPHQYLSTDAGTRIYLKKEKYNYLFEAKKKRMSLYLHNLCKVVYSEDGWVELNLGKPSASIVTKDFLKNNLKDVNFIREYPATSKHDGITAMNKLLEKYIGDEVVIPFSFEERKRRYPLAFKELNKYMQKYMSS